MSSIRNPQSAIRNSAAGPPRRNLLAALAAGSLSVVAGVAALVPGLAVFVAPLRGKGKAKASPIHVAMLEEIPPDGLPHRFPVVDRRVDAWNLYPPEPIGAVYLFRGSAAQKPGCFTATCPHLGCAVDFEPEEVQYICPCHASGFSLSGEVLAGPSPRPLDSLQVEVRKGREVWVLFEEFRSGVEAKEAKE